MKITKKLLTDLIFYAFLLGSLLGFISGYLIEMMYANAECYNILIYTRRYTCDSMFLSYDGFRKFTSNIIDSHNEGLSYILENIPVPNKTSDNMTFSEYESGRYNENMINLTKFKSYKDEKN